MSAYKRLYCNTNKIVLRGILSLIDVNDRTVGRSFRIKERWLNILKYEAKREGITVNSLMNRILEDYSLFYRYYERYDVMTMTQTSLARIVESCPKADLRGIAKMGGSINLEDIFRTLGFELSYENLVFFMEKVYCKYAKWFECEHYVRKGMEIFHLRHNLGKK